MRRKEMRRKKRRESKHFSTIILLSAVIGLGVGLLVSLFHITINVVLSGRLDFVAQYWTEEQMLWLPYMLLSAVMVFLSVYLVRFYAPEAGGSGIQEIEGVAMGKRRMHEFRVLVVKFVGGVLSIGASMSMGREGPSVQMGGALGQIASRISTLDSDEIRTLVVAGAGAGLATAFNAPLAGIIFVFEEMRRGVKFRYVSVQSVVTTVVVSILVLRIVVGNSIAIPVEHVVPPHAIDIWIFVVFGLLFGILGYLFNAMLLTFIEGISDLRGGGYYLLVFIIGGLVGLLWYIDPQSVGEGYRTVHSALHGALTVQTALILFVLRFFTTMLSYGTGAPGGIFAPMMALGSLFGIAFGELTARYLPGLGIDPLVFAIVGMSALFSATVRAPLTGIVLVAEMTASFNLLLPLLLTSLVATITVNSMGGRPIYTILLERTLAIAKFGTN